MSEAFSKWYESNKTALLKRRKLKYRIDSSFRDDMKKRSKEYYKTKLKKSFPRTIMEIDGEKFFTIGGLARVINRKEQTIREYHSHGVIPTPDVGNARQWRIYSIRRTKIIREAFSQFDNGKISSLKEVKEFIHKQW